MFDEVIIDFSYIDKYFDMIMSKIKTTGTITMFNGIENLVFFLEKKEDKIQIYYYDVVENENIYIEYNDLVGEFMELFKNSMGTINIMYRVYVGQYNKNTDGEFRELWGDILFIDQDDFSLKSHNISSDKLSNAMININLTEEEIKYFGKPEEYVFMDDNGDIIMGLDLI